MSLKYEPSSVGARAAGPNEAEEHRLVLRQQGEARGHGHGYGGHDAAQRARVGEGGAPQGLREEGPPGYEPRI